jgi:hypothetical protein
MHGNVCKAIYVHSDGYLEYTGAVLNKFYDSTKANFLVAQGDCSVLGMDIGEKIDFNDRMTYVVDADVGMNVATQCRFYKRDRDEDTSWTVAHSFEELTQKFGMEYYYIMQDGEWYVSIGGTSLHRLSEVLARNTEAVEA